MLFNIVTDYGYCKCFTDDPGGYGKRFNNDLSGKYGVIDLFFNYRKHVVYGGYNTIDSGNNQRNLFGNRFEWNLHSNVGTGFCYRGVTTCDAYDHSWWSNHFLFRRICRFVFKPNNR